MTAPWRDGAVDPQDVEIDFTVAHPARVYDYLLGGKVNFDVDREAASGASLLTGGLDAARRNVRSQRAFLRAAVEHLVTEAGVRQFLDIGSGIPTENNVHQVAQRAAPESRIVYVDNDPIVIAHAHELKRSTPEGATTFLFKDLRDPAGVLAEAAKTLNFDQPIAVILVGILHLIPDDDDPYGIVARLLDAVPDGSYLAISHLASDIEADETAQAFSRINQTMSEPFVLRPRDAVSRFLDGLEPVDPGVVRLDQWRNVPAYDDGVIRAYGAVARKQ